MNGMPLISTVLIRIGSVINSSSVTIIRNKTPTHRSMKMTMQTKQIMTPMAENRLEISAAVIRTVLRIATMLHLTSSCIHSDHLVHQAI